MRLADIVGHSGPLRLIQRLLVSGRLPQGLIIEGPPGSGRRTLALAIAQARLCEAPEPGDACGVCDACWLIEADNHPDTCILPDARHSADLPVELIRDQVVAAAQRSPLRGRGTAIVIPDAGRLRGPAANALLKVLEEPPPGTSFIFTMVSAAGLLATIRSRSQVIRLQALPPDAIARVLMAHGHEVEQARAAGRAGSLRAVDEVLEQAPLAELLSLLDEGPVPSLVAEIMDRLTAAERQGAGDQRLILGRWIDATIAALRERLRDRRGASGASGTSGASGNAAAMNAERIQNLLELRGDLSRYLPARLVVEAIGLTAA